MEPEKPHWFAQAGAYGGKDLQGDNPGTMQAARFVWNPVKDKDEVIHVGLAASLENPRGWQDGRGISHVRTSRFRSRPEAGLTDVRLIDSGALPYTDSILRTGLEGAWRRGPLYLQGEALQAQVNRGEGKPDYTGNGQYAGQLMP
jgi:phosphate-selective porin OprO/OprP